MGFKNAVGIEPTAFLAFFRFLLSRGTIVHLPSQENKIQNLSQQPTVCQKYFFDTLKAIRFSNRFFTYIIYNNITLYICYFLSFFWHIAGF